MGVGIIDIGVFVIFVATVIGIGLWKSRNEEIDSEQGARDYFLAGRGLTWWLVGFSLIAANISTEQFVGMSGKAADWLGMAIASYKWMAAITLVIVAFLFVPTFLKSGIFTIPEFLEYRYNPFARTVMAISTLVILVGVPTASVIYSGAKVITVNFQGQSLFGLDLGSITVGCWIIGTLAAIYVFAGGLKACAWADLLQGTALIIGGAIIAYLAMRFLGNADPAALAATATTSIDPSQLADAGAIERLQMLNAGDWETGKLHMVKPASDPEIPWTALVVGLWIPNFFYWGLNQYIVTVGKVFRADGIGLRDQYRISGPELESMCDIARSVPGVLGERMLGGGDKGAAGAIVRSRSVNGLATAVETGYPRSHPSFAEDFAVHVCGLVDGITTLDGTLGSEPR